MKIIRTFARSESAQGLVEYTLIVAFIAMAAFASLLLLGKQVNSGLARGVGDFP